MNILQLISIFIEFIIVIVSLMVAVRQKKIYGYFFALTFAVYVFYDTAKLSSSVINETLLTAMFFIATVSMLAAVLTLYKDNTKK
jgi:hypothetical protein